MNAMHDTSASNAQQDTSASISAAPPSSTSGADWKLGPRVPQTRGRLLRRIGLWLMTRAGWRFEGAMPDAPKFVVIVAPHTSNWDFPLGLAAKWALGFDAHWWGKDTLFTPPLGWFMRANGGIPVHRHQSSQVVDETVAAFRANAQFALALAPEGTRKRVTKWRTGFWHVAKGAQVPICCVAFDWSRRVVRLGPTTTPVEADAEAGIARMRSYFSDIQGYNPQLQA